MAFQISKEEYEFLLKRREEKVSAESKKIDFIQELIKTKDVLLMLEEFSKKSNKYKELDFNLTTGDGDSLCVNLPFIVADKIMKIIAMEITKNIGATVMQQANVEYKGSELEKLLKALEKEFICQK